MQEGLEEGASVGPGDVEDQGFGARIFRTGIVLYLQGNDKGDEREEGPCKDCLAMVRAGQPLKDEVAEPLVPSAARVRDHLSSGENSPDSLL